MRPLCCLWRKEKREQHGCDSGVAAGATREVKQQVRAVSRCGGMQQLGKGVMPLAVVQSVSVMKNEYKQQCAQDMYASWGMQCAHRQRRCCQPGWLVGESFVHAASAQQALQREEQQRGRHDRHAHQHACSAAGAAAGGSKQGLATQARKVPACMCARMPGHGCSRRRHRAVHPTAAAAAAAPPPAHWWTPLGPWGRTGRPGAKVL